MKRKALSGLRLLFSLVLFATGGGQNGGLRFLVQQIEVIGARQWFGLMAGAIVANTPVLAPVSRRIAGGFGRRATASAVDDEETASDTA